MSPTPPASATPASPLPVIAFLGPLMGKHPGWVTGQTEIVAERFRRDGFVVHAASDHRSRAGRLVDMERSIVRWRGDVDVVVEAVFASTPSFVLHDLTSLTRKLVGLPTIMVLHSGDMPERLISHPKWVRRVLSRADLVVTPSAFLSSIPEQLGLPHMVVPNLVDLPDYDAVVRTALRPRLLWMRTFWDIYNPDMAIRVLHRLRGAGIDASLTMAGQTALPGSTDAPNPVLQRVRQLAASLGVDAHVTFPGFLRGDDKRRAMADHDVFLNTNRVDNTPVSVIEAAASGMAVIATDVGGLSHVVEHGRSAVLVPDDDDEAMAGAIRGLLDDPSQAEQLSRGAIERASTFGWPAVRAGWMEAFERVQTKRGR